MKTSEPPNFRDSNSKCCYSCKHRKLQFSDFDKYDLLTMCRVYDIEVKNLWICDDYEAEVSDG